jgi:AraC family transcriptional regulator of adaptative response/methylated-DNA-[protein]-cysteine methyltransferase
MTTIETQESAEDYTRIARAIVYIDAHHRRQPSLDDIAAHAGLSKYHFIRLFKRWAGITPMQFLQFLTIEHSKKMLESSKNLLDTAYEAGLSGPGRLHDLFVTFEAMTPGEYKRLGQELQIRYGFHPCPFGLCLLALTERGICYLGFTEPGKEESALDDLQRRWPNGNFSKNHGLTATVVHDIFYREHTEAGTSKPFHLLLKGTNFQVNVWKGLLNIPVGSRICYEDLANLLGRPGAHRAVASAVAANPLGYLIPCHRVIAKSGKISDYRWGRTRKSAILCHEAAITP